MKKFGFIFLFILLFLFGCSSESMPEYESYSYDSDFGPRYLRTYTTLSECDKSIDLGNMDWVVRYDDVSFLGEFSKYITYSHLPEYAGKREHRCQIFYFKNHRNEEYSLRILHQHEEASPKFIESEWGGMRAKTSPMPQMDNFMIAADGMKAYKGYYYRGIIYEYGNYGKLIEISWSTGRSLCRLQLYDQNHYGFEYDLSDEDSIIAQLVDPERAEKAVARMTRAILAPYYRSVFLKWLPVILIVAGVGTTVTVYCVRRKKHMNHIRQIMMQTTPPQAES